MKRDILVIGLGYFGSRVTKTLSEHGQNVMVVDMREERVEANLPLATNGRIGDATDPSFIESLAPRDYDVCVVAIGDNFLNSLQVTSLLKDMGAQYVVSRATSDVQEKFLLRNGARTRSSSRSGPARIGRPCATRRRASLTTCRWATTTP